MFGNKGKTIIDKSGGSIVTAILLLATSIFFLTASAKHLRIISLNMFIIMERAIIITSK